MFAGRKKKTENLKKSGVSAGRFPNSDRILALSAPKSDIYSAINYSGRSRQGKFDAFAHGVDAFGADADFVA
jgi:hypothetical protein